MLLGNYSCSWINMAWYRCVIVKVQVLVANLKDRFKFHKFSAQFFGNHCFSLVLYNWSWQSYNGAVLKKLNVHGLIWLGNDTVSLMVLYLLLLWMLKRDVEFFRNLGNCKC